MDLRSNTIFSFPFVILLNKLKKKIKRSSSGSLLSEVVGVALG